MHKSPSVNLRWLFLSLLPRLTAQAAQCGAGGVQDALRTGAMLAPAKSEHCATAIEILGQGVQLVPASNVLIMLTLALWPAISDFCGA